MAFKNRLAAESSPYLRQHADNPVDWYPWGEEALKEAKRLDKPILLSVGYSACHWCHVMAHESFEDPETARRMNEGFINIKVDREERPDLDQVYQGVVQLMGRSGGWPLTVFLTPDLKPFFGGTYFPNEDKYGMSSFQKTLGALGEAYATHRSDVETQADQFLHGLKHLAAYGLGESSSAISSEDVANAGAQLAREVDEKHGGFGQAPKFPNPMNVALLFRASRRDGSLPVRDAALFTLRKMALGGIYDQLGGGFHRYSVDARWLVPHFEKMLYDNAQLLHLYTEAFQLDPDPLFARVVEETVAYVEREMTSPDGGFYATQDADSEHVEGKFFVWTSAEIDALLTPDLAASFKAWFGVTAKGNFEHGQSILEVVHVDESQRAKVDEAREILFRAREQRVKPGRDDKILTGWNGLMIRGLAFAGQVFARPEWTKLASRAADFVLEQALRGGRLTRVFQDGKAKVDGFLEDYGDLAAGLTALYSATFEPRYLEAALALTRTARAEFWDEEKKAYLAAPRGQADLLTVPFALHDNAVPSGASTMTEALVSLAAVLSQPELLEEARVYVERMKDEMVRNPFGYGHLWLAADALIDGAAEVTVVGSEAERAPFFEALRRVYAPTLARVALEPAEVPRILAATAAGRFRVGGKAAAYLCRGFACQRPETDPAKLVAAL